MASLNAGAESAVTLIKNGQVGGGLRGEEARNDLGTPQAHGPGDAAVPALSFQKAKR